MKFQTAENIIIAGHRGNPAYVSENTLKSFKSAIDAGVDMIETDVRMSKDGVLVLLHDPDLKRVANKDLNVRDLTLKEIKEINVGTEKEPMQIPTLDEFFELFAKHEDLLFDLEIKVYKHVEGEAATIETVDKTIALCEKYNVCDRILFNSFDAFVLEYIHEKHEKRFKLHGYYPCGDIMHNIKIDPLTYMDYACYWASGDEAKQICEILKSHGIEPCTGSNTTEEDFYFASKLGCSMFTENDPASFVKWRKNNF